MRNPQAEFMKIHYYPETDSLYIDLSSRPSVDSQEISEGVVVDFDADRQIVGMDIQHASKTLDLGNLQVESLPVKIAAPGKGRRAGKSSRP